jgi:tungstate transport system permease protein
MAIPRASIQAEHLKPNIFCVARAYFRPISPNVSRAGYRASDIAPIAAGSRLHVPTAACFRCAHACPLQFLRAIASAGAGAAMSDIGRAFALALSLVAHPDAELIGIVLLSLGVSIAASAIGFLLGLPIGGWLAATRFRGRTAVLVGANAALGLPPVVVGLAIYLLLSRSGPLGALGLLFTPGAMIIAQSILTLPIVIALTHRLIEGLWADYGDALVMDGAPKFRCIAVLLQAGRSGLVTVFLSAFGRAIAEVGAILIVGGNIRGSTRTMTTAIALETSTGDLPLALALGLILITLSVAVSAAAFGVNRLVARDGKR